VHTRRSERWSVSDERLQCGQHDVIGVSYGGQLRWRYAGPPIAEACERRQGMVGFEQTSAERATIEQQLGINDRASFPPQ
jgi:hypothetical protein